MLSFQHTFASIFSFPFTFFFNYLSFSVHFCFNYIFFLLHFCQDPSNFLIGVSSISSTKFFVPTLLLICLSRRADSLDGRSTSGGWVPIYWHISCRPQHGKFRGLRRVVTGTVSRWRSWKQRYIRMLFLDKRCLLLCQVFQIHREVRKWN